MSEYINNVKLAAYGAQGCRKTLQIGYLIDRFGAENVGIVSCEAGLSTIASVVNPAYVKEVHDKAGLREAWAWAQRTFTRPDQWVCVDGGTRALQWLQDEIWGHTQKAYERILDGDKPQDLPASLRPYSMFVTKGGEINTQGMWVRLGMDAQQLFNSFVRLTPSAYWTFWEELSSIDQFQKGPPWKPDTPGKAAFDSIKGAFDYVFRLVRDGDASTAYCNDNEPRRYFAKRRDDHRKFRVPDEIKAFDLGDFATRIRGEGWPAK